jgi:hypothetical protein
METSNLPLGRWGETFADDVVAADRIDRLVHHSGPDPDRRHLPHPAAPGLLPKNNWLRTPNSLWFGGGASR